MAIVRTPSGGFHAYYQGTEQRNGHIPGVDQFGALSPYLRAHISRFGAYATDDLTRQPEAFNPVLKEVDFTARSLAA
jgi:hypothetical protein